MAGVLPALGAAIGFAIFQLVNRRALQTVDVYRGTASILAIGAALLMAVAGITGGLALVPEAPVSALLFCAAAGFVHFFCGWTFLAWSQVRLGAARAGILIGTVPLFGALVAAALLDEPLSSLDLVGLVLVVVGVWIVSARSGVTTAAPTRRTHLGIAAGLATALCWSSSPVLIRQGLEGLPSPTAGAGLGMLASALVYALGVVLTKRRANRSPIDGATRRLLLITGIAASSAIWMQWTAFDLTAVATVLAVLQLTPITVVILASRIGGDRLDGRALQRVLAGALLTVTGSLLLVLG
ncbi:MAG: DMT family transporter [Actinobacteria bacterium]|jgi:drug/metabolite transporter (DMT)-like permease|nr:DMT family transporter [Actinomycetota bacterium]